MSLSQLIEKALSLERSAGGRLCNQITSQTFIPTFVASSSQTLTITPPDNSYGAIAYQLQIHDEEPWCWTIVIQAYGVAALTLTVPDNLIYPTWLELTERNKLDINITNRDNLLRSFAMSVSYLIVPDKNDLDELKRRLKDDIDTVTSCIERSYNRLCIGGKR